MLAAALPYAIREDGKETPLFPWELDALRAAGIPLFSDLLTEEPGEDGELILRTGPFVCPEPSNWRFPAAAVPPEARDFLMAKGLLSRDNLSRYRPTEEGKRLGLCTMSWFCPSNFARINSLFCSTAGWLYRLWEPREKPPLWLPRSLDTRLECMQAGRAGNLGHTVAALEQLDAMPMEPLLLNMLDSDYLEENLERLQMLYPPGITYGQAARDADRRMHSNAAADQEDGEEIMEYSKVLFIYTYNCSEKGVPFVNSANKKITALHKTRLDARSLSARLAHSEIWEISESYLPLSGDNLEDVFRGLSVLVDTDVPMQGFYQEMLPWLAAYFGHRIDKWDGSFGGLIRRLVKEAEAKEKDIFSGIDGEDCDDVGADFDNMSLHDVFWRLLIEPFCLLEQARKQKEERDRLLERFQVWNESLRQELEGMNFDGNVC